MALSAIHPAPRVPVLFSFEQSSFFAVPLVRPPCIQRLQFSCPKVVRYLKKNVWSCALHNDDGNDQSLLDAFTSGTGTSIPPSVHFIGIGGAGLSALALVALKQGWRVTGSDMADSDRLQKLQVAGAKVYVGHEASHIAAFDGRPNTVVMSSAVSMDNEEVQMALSLGITVLKRGEWLGKLTKDKELIAVAGSHGKSTTSAMLSLALRDLGDDITAVVGAEILQFPDGGNAMVGSSPRFVLEADEYDGCFLGVEPQLAVVTNVEWEHVDIYSSEAAVRAVFQQFVDRIRPGGSLIVCGDSAGSRFLATALNELAGESQVMTTGKSNERASWLDGRSPRQAVTYGLGEDCDWRATMLVPNTVGGTDYVVVHEGRPITRVSLRIPGAHNVLNSLAVVVAAALLAARDMPAGDGSAQMAAMLRTAQSVSQTLAQFQGVKRRFELVGRAKGCVVLDDYAHHPSEVRATLQAARQRFNQQPLWVVFQPHTFSRLARLLPDFAPAFSAADRVIVTQVYAAREENVWGITGANLADEITGPPAVYIPSFEKVLERLSWEITATAVDSSRTQEEIVVLTLGAGDVTRLGPQLLATLSDKTS